jgi:hypothetical protein
MMFWKRAASLPHPSKRDGAEFAVLMNFVLRGVVFLVPDVE